MARLPRLLVLTVVLAFLSSCGGKHATAPPTGALQLESSRAASATIGAEGGVLVATGSNGVRYSLVVPENALAAPTRLTITPVSRMPLPGTGALAAGLDCRPSGLSFAHAAVLVVESAGAPGAGAFSIGFSATADADSFALNGAVSSGGRFVLQVSHFSIQGIQFGTTADLASYPSPPVDQVSESFYDRIQRAVNAEDLVQARTLAGQWATAAIVPNLGDAANDAALLAAVSDYDHWRAAIDLINNFVPLEQLGGAPPVVVGHVEDAAFAGAEHDAREAAAPALRAAIAGNATVACDQENFSALANVVFWYGVAQALGVADLAHQLDEASVFASLCARVVLDGLSLPGTLQVGFPHSLDLDLGIRFGDHAGSRGAPFRVQVSATNATLQHPSGFTDAAGHYTTVVSATADGPVDVDVIAHLVLPGTTLDTPIHATFHSSGSAGQDLTGDYFGSVNFVCFGAIQSWRITAHLDQNQNSISGTWQVHDTFCNPGVDGGILSGTIADGKLLDFSMTHPPCGEPSDPPLVTGVRMDPGDTLRVTQGGHHIEGSCHGAFGCSHGTDAPSVVGLTSLVFERATALPAARPMRAVGDRPRFAELGSRRGR